MKGWLLPFLLISGLVMGGQLARADQTPEASQEFGQILQDDRSQNKVLNLDQQNQPQNSGRRNQKSNSTGPTYVHNPLSKEGLYRITANGTYLYRTKPRSGHQAFNLSFGSMSAPDILNPDTDATYKDLYGAQAAGLLFSYEYQLFHARIGILSAQFGSGFLMASGHGRFVNSSMAGKQPREGFTFYTIPNSVSLVYRLQLWDTQPLIPYALGGGDYFGFIESRNDKKPARLGAAPAFHVAVGVALNLNTFDPNHHSPIGEGYGITDVYLYAEYRRITGLASPIHLSGQSNHWQANVSSQVYSGGIMAEF